MIDGGSLEIRIKGMELTERTSFSIPSNDRISSIRVINKGNSAFPIRGRTIHYS